jgi:hypothetical protein
LTGPTAVVIFPPRSGGNHAGTSRMTLMNVNASPTPSTMRADNASGGECATASMTWAAPISSDPVMMSRLEPYRSISTPTGTCSVA